MNSFWDVGEKLVVERLNPESVATLFSKVTVNNTVHRQSFVHCTYPTIGVGIFVNQCVL